MTKDIPHIQKSNTSFWGNGQVAKLSPFHGEDGSSILPYPIYSRLITGVLLIYYCFPEIFNESAESYCI